MTLTNLKDLDALDRAALLAQWRSAFGPPPPKLSQPLMRRMLAFERQAKTAGDLTSDARRALAAVLKDDAPRTPNPGTLLLREWKGVVHEVEVVDGGYRWRGAVWRSLSAIATEITGVKWSGPRFFRIKR